MKKTVGVLNSIEVLMYRDTITVFGRTLKEHEECLEKVLKRLNDVG